MDLVSQNLLMTSGGKKDPVYLDDVFSTYLYKGNGAAQEINNGIKLSNNNAGNGINFDETCFNLKFDASTIQKTSELIWQPNSTLPYSTLKPLPHPFSSISDLAGEMAVHNHGKTGLIGKKQLFDEVLLLDDSLMDHFILHVKNHIEEPTRDSAQLIADIRCWTSWLSNGIKI